jgi:ferredoxin-thioredoxin reductase catalytic chain
MEKTITFEEALERAKRMSERYVERGPYQFFPAADMVDSIQQGLAKNLVNHGRLYCPWMTLSGDPVEDRKKICPCERHHEDIARDGYCIWMFFVSEEFLRRYEETGEIAPSTLGEVAPLGESLFPAAEEAARLPKSKRGPKKP